jgi:hypothetical protein
MVDVKYLNYQTTLPLLVANSDGPALLGRAWFDALQISVTGVNRASTHPFELDGSSLPVQLTDFSENFQETESCTGPDSHINLRADTVPVFLTAEPVPLALQAAVGQEIDGVVEAEVLQTTTTLQATSSVRESCDSSAYGLGAVTSQTIADGTTERRIANGSRTLKPAEINYTPCDTAHYKITRQENPACPVPFYKHKAPGSSKKLEAMAIERCHLYQLPWKSDTRPVNAVNPNIHVSNSSCNIYSAIPKVPKLVSETTYQLSRYTTIHRDNLDRQYPLQPVISASPILFNPSILPTTTQLLSSEERHLY